MDTEDLMHALNDSLQGLHTEARRWTATLTAGSRFVRLLLALTLLLLALSLLASVALFWQHQDLRRESLAVHKLMLQSETAVLQNTQTIAALTRTLLEQYRVPHP